MLILPAYSSSQSNLFIEILYLRVYIPVDEGRAVRIVEPDEPSPSSILKRGSTKKSSTASPSMYYAIMTMSKRSLLKH